mmetsp:Transcript_6053/g.10061  ORF Transcript_6053/g.10061 Transcript_6053/m.10061 type:complete len:226 (+) Transcript_6053:1384-2061(+)
MSQQPDASASIPMLRQYSPPRPYPESFSRRCANMYGSSAAGASSLPYSASSDRASCTGTSTVITAEGGMPNLRDRRFISMFTGICCVGERTAVTTTKSQRAMVWLPDNGGEPVAAAQHLSINRSSWPLSAGVSGSLLVTCRMPKSIITFANDSLDVVRSDHCCRRFLLTQVIPDPAWPTSSINLPSPTVVEVVAAVVVAVVVAAAASSSARIISVDCEERKSDSR